MHTVAFQNTFATVPGIVAPLITAGLVNVEAKDLASHWQAVFFLSAAISATGVMCYVLGARDQLDPALAWAADGEAVDTNTSINAGSSESQSLELQRKF